MKVFHLRKHRWVRNKSITKKLTFASCSADAIKLCIADFAKEQGCNTDLVAMHYKYPLVTCSVSKLEGTIKKVYMLVDYLYDKETDERLCKSN